MCLKLGDQRCCLSLLTLLGVLQGVLALPIIILSFIQFSSSSLGAALSPFWCGFILLASGVLAIFIRPTRLACVIFFHVLLNSFAISACFLAAGITGLYGTAVHMPEFQQFMEVQRTRGNSTCIFDPASPLYTENFRDAFQSVDGLVNSCEDLDQYWRFLISIMALSFIGFLVSILAIISDCAAPCVEEKYDSKKLRKGTAV